MGNLIASIVQENSEMTFYYSCDTLNTMSKMTKYTKVFLTLNEDQKQNSVLCLENFGGHLLFPNFPENPLRKYKLLVWKLDVCMKIPYLFSAKLKIINRDA